MTSHTQQQTVSKLQEATQKLSQASDEQERTYWANQISRHASDLTPSGSKNQRTAVTVDAEVPGPEAFQRISQSLFSQQTPGLKDVSFRQEGGRTKVRIQATPEALPRIQEVLGRVGEQMQMAYSGNISGSSN